MTERLYYNDPYLSEFDATVLGVERHEGRAAVVLDRTAFYPTSGGQPFDVGFLGGAAVSDVIERDDGVILHVVDGEIETAPVEGLNLIHGVIDWRRRFEHMQQHTGQHVLSAAFDRLLDARTESFHLGSLASTIDLNRTLSAVDIDRAEDEANRVVWDDRPIAIRFVDAEEAARLPLRKEPARTGRLRIIEIAGFDVSACGGTHVARTGAIGTIVVRSSERFRGGTRVEFLCGVRALRGFRELRGAIDASVRLVSVLPSELPAGIERLQADARDARRNIKDLHSRLASFEADALARSAEHIGTMHTVIAALEGWDQQGLKTIAAAVAARPGHIAALFSVPAPSAVVIARAADVAADSDALLKKLTARFGGKGGGRADLAQGGGLQGTPADFVGFVRTALS